MSRDDANVKMAELQVRVQNEIQRRNYAQQQAYNQWLQGYGAFLQDLGTWSQSMHTAPSPPTTNFRAPVTCYSLGNMIRCY
jgi:hypothetical protein